MRPNLQPTRLGNPPTYTSNMSLCLTRNQVRRVDQLAMERYGIAGIILMENAGRNASEVIRTTYGEAGTAVICCGTGNNGGDGLVIARHLHNAGWTVSILMAGDHARCTPDTAVNLNIVRKMGIRHEIASAEDEQQSAVRGAGPDAIVVDALLGTGFRGDVRTPLSDLIQSINTTAHRAVVAIDVPSGLDCDTGNDSNATIRADVTVTFVAEKVGFATTTAKAFVGRVEVVDIGAPLGIISEVTKA